MGLLSVCSDFIVLSSLFWTVPPQTTGCSPRWGHMVPRTFYPGVGQNPLAQEAPHRPPRPLDGGPCPPWGTCVGQRGGLPQEALWDTSRRPEAWRRMTWTTGAGVRTFCVSVLMITIGFLVWLSGEQFRLHRGYKTSIFSLKILWPVLLFRWLLYPSFRPFVPFVIRCLLFVVAVDSSESSGESVSGFSSSGHSFHSAVAGEAEDTSSVCSSTITIKEVAAALAGAAGSPGGPNSLAVAPEKPQPSVVSAEPKPQCPAKDLSCGKVK